MPPLPCADSPHLTQEEHQQQLEAPTPAAGRPAAAELLWSECEPHLLADLLCKSLLHHRLQQHQRHRARNSHSDYPNSSSSSSSGTAIPQPAAEAAEATTAIIGTAGDTEAAVTPAGTVVESDDHSSSGRITSTTNAALRKALKAKRRQRLGLKAAAAAGSSASSSPRQSELKAAAVHDARTVETRQLTRRRRTQSITEADRYSSSGTLTVNTSITASQQLQQEQYQYLRQCLPDSTTEQQQQSHSSLPRVAGPDITTASQDDDCMIIEELSTPIVKQDVCGDSSSLSEEIGTLDYHHRQSSTAVTCGNYVLDCAATAKAAVQWVCFPSLLSSNKRSVSSSSLTGLTAAAMPCKFSRVNGASTDVHMVSSDDEHDIVKMDTSPTTPPPSGGYTNCLPQTGSAVDLFSVLPQKSKADSEADYIAVLSEHQRHQVAALLNNNIRTVHYKKVKCPLKDGCPDNWTWNRHDKSHEVRLHGTKGQSAHFHPNWSNGTAGVRGTKVLNTGRYYWEVNISQRVFGTSMMFGISTKNARLHVDAFVNLLGEDDHSWGLSHKGLLWHNGKWRQYTSPFRENEATTIGCLFDGHQGTLTFYKDGVCLGIAFTGLDKVSDELFPTVCSTAAKTEMSLGATVRGFTDLQDRCRAAIVASLHEENAIDALPLPNRVKEFIRDGCSSPH